MFYSPHTRTKQELKKRERNMKLSNTHFSKLNFGNSNFSNTDAGTYLKEASALIGLLLVVYLWSLVAMALQA
jgi:hypothetical protein